MGEIVVEVVVWGMQSMILWKWLYQWGWGDRQFHLHRWDVESRLKVGSGVVDNRLREE